MSSRFGSILACLILGVSIVAASSGCGNQQPGGDPSSRTGPRDREAARPTQTTRSRESTLVQIRRLIAIGDLGQALRIVQSHLVRDPHDPEALLLGAQIYAAGQQIDDAVEMLETAASHSSDRRLYFLAQAAILLAEAGRHQQAIERLQDVVAQDPQYDEARHELANLLTARGYRFDANEQVRVLCRRQQATGQQLRGLILPTQSLIAFPEEPDIDDPDVIGRYGAMNVARRWFAQGKVGDALRVIETSQPMQRRHPAAVALVGQLLLESQRFAEFEQWLPTAEAGCQRYPAYWMALGGWAMRQRDYDSAIRMFAEAIAREPGDLKAHDRIKQALAAAGQDEASEQFRLRAVEIDSVTRLAIDLIQGDTVAPNRDGLRRISEISRVLSRIGRVAESVQWSRIALERMGSPPQAMQQLVEASKQLDEPEFQESVQRTILCGIDLEKYPLDVASVTGGRRPDDPREPDRERPAWVTPSFVNIASTLGLDFQYRNAAVPVKREHLIFQQIGGGVACLDYDLDGRVDLYAVQAAGDPPDGPGTQPNLLSRNLTERFRDVTAVAGCDDRGFGCGVTAGDWNQDGFPDLVVANIQRNTLLINQGDGTFRFQSGDGVWEQAEYTASLAIADVDGNHLPDIVEINYLDDPRIYDPIEHHPDGTPIALPAPNLFRSAIDRVFVSRGNGGMEGRILGGGQVRGNGLGLVVTDIDGQPGNEIFVANDHTANHYWDCASDGDATWRNSAAVRGLAFGTTGTPMGSMGIAVADFDDNGLVDFHVTNFENQWSHHLMQVESGFFDDLPVAYGLGEPTFKMVGFGTQAIDFDNNTSIDLVIGNGHIEDFTAGGRTKFQMPTQMFVGLGSGFEQVAVGGDNGYWDSDHLTRALAYCDWNRDGRIDFVTTDMQQPLALLDNRTETPYHWVQLRLVGTHSERDAIGATMIATHGGRAVTKVVQTGDGYMCKNEPIVHFGLGHDAAIERLEIRWPSGNQQVLTDLAADRRWLIIEGNDSAFELEHP